MRLEVVLARSGLPVLDLEEAARGLAPLLAWHRHHGVEPMAGCLATAASTAMELMFSPPEMMMSLKRSRIWRYESG